MLIELDPTDPTVDFDPEHLTRDYGAYYRTLGWQAISAHVPEHGGQWKRPVPDWRQFQNGQVNDDTFANWFRGHTGESVNVGVLTGEASGRLLLIDLDTYKGPEAMAWWHAMMQKHNNGMELETVMQMTGGGGLQLFFKAPAGTTGLTIASTSMHVDIRYNNGFGVLTPSRHASGRRYEWIEGCAPWEIEVADAPQWLIDEIKALIVSHGGGGVGKGLAGVVKGPAPAGAFRMEGSLLPQPIQIDDREMEMTRWVMGRLVDLRRQDPAYPTPEVIEAQIVTLFGHWSRKVGAQHPEQHPVDMPNAEKLEREGRGISLMRAKFARDLKHWDTVIAEKASEPPPKEEGVAETSSPPPPDPGPPEDWDTPVAKPIPTVDYVYDPWSEQPLPEFPLDTLPASLQHFVRDTSQSMGADLSAIAMCSLAMCGAALDQSFRLKMMAQGGDWMVPPRLWVMLLADSGTMKTPILGTLGRVMMEREQDSLERWRASERAWKANGGKEEDRPAPPTRYMMNQSSPEMIAKTLSTQNRGIFMFIDELNQWLGSMEGKGNNGKEKGFWTNIFNGGYYNTNTLLRNVEEVKNFCATIIGGMQPKELNKYKDLTGSGLLQRFFPIYLGEEKLPQMVDDRHSRSYWNDLQTRLLGMVGTLVRGEGGSIIKASPEAHEVFTGFRIYVHSMRTNKNINDNFRSFLGKVNGLHGSLSLILHFIDPNAPPEISGGTAKRALRIIKEFVLPHALRMYEREGEGGVEELMDIFSFVLRSDVVRFKMSHFHQRFKNLRDKTPEQLDEYLGPLKTCEWLTLEDKRAATLTWVMTPGIREALSERRADEQRKADEGHARLAELRGKKRVDTPADGV